MSMIQNYAACVVRDQLKASLIDTLTDHKYRLADALAQLVSAVYTCQSTATLDELATEAEHALDLAMPNWRKEARP